MRIAAILQASVTLTIFCARPLQLAADLVHAKDGSGVYGYNDTPVLPWCGYRVHDADRPAPKRVNVPPGPETPAPPPSDAIVLFAGRTFRSGNQINARWWMVALKLGRAS
jgi:hypothetical protein